MSNYKDDHNHTHHSNRVRNPYHADTTSKNNNNINNSAIYSHTNTDIYNLNSTMIGDENLLNMLGDPVIPLPSTETFTAATTAKITSSVEAAAASAAASSNDSDNKNGNNNTNNDPSLESLQAQVEHLQEANFDLEATLATMQAEQQYAIQQLEDRMKDERAKLQHALRLEQQATQRLVQQQQQQQHPLSKRVRVDVDQTALLLDTFQKRLPSSAVGVGGSPIRKEEDASLSMMNENDNEDPNVGLESTVSPSARPPPEITLPAGRPSSGTAAATTTMMTTPLASSPWPPESATTTTTTTTTTLNTTTIAGNNPGFQTTTTTVAVRSSSSSTSSANTVSGAAWLARQLLYHCPQPSSSSSSLTPSIDICNFLIPIATNTHTGNDTDTESMCCWTEAQLVEYLLLQQQQQPPPPPPQEQRTPGEALPCDYWTEALLLSRAARCGIRRAMEQLEQKPNNEGDAETNMIAPPPRRRRPKPRIHRLNPDASRGAPVEYNPASLAERRRHLWYTPETNHKATLDSSLYNTFMNPESVQDWVDNRLDTDNPKHLQLLAWILEEDSGAGAGSCCEPHSTRIWWNILLSGITSELIRLHAKLITTNNNTNNIGAQTSSTARTTGRPLAQSQRRGSNNVNLNRGNRQSNRHSTSGAIGQATTTWKDLWGGQSPRRLRFQPLTSTTTTNKTSPTSTAATTTSRDEQEELLLACLTLMERLIAVTKLDILEKWYALPRDGAPPKQPYLLEDLADASEEESGAALMWIGLLLDILEGLEHRPQNPQQQQNQQSFLAFPKWYLPLVSLFATIGQTKAGMKALRTRLPDLAGGEVMPNVLDTATMQLFHLSLLEEEDEEVNDCTASNNDASVACYSVDYRTVHKEQRHFVMDYWIRLWHQALLFVQGQTAYGETSQATSSRKTATVISFRSLLVDLHDYYTSACMRILSDPFRKPEIHAMIRMQLEELGYDEEEHDDWKG